MNPTLQSPQPMHKKRSKDDIKKIVLLAVFILIGLGIALGAFLITRQQNLENRASTQNLSDIACPVDGASCEWEAAQAPAGMTVADQTSYQSSQTYNFTIIDKTTGSTIKTGTTSSTKVPFTPTLGHTYQCKVVTVSKCGVCDEQSTEGTCNAFLSPTPTPSSTPTPTTIPPSPTPTVTPNPQCGTACTTNSECPDQHSCSNGKCVLTKCTIAGNQCTEDKCSYIPPSPTPTPTATNTPTPTPTDTPTPTMTSTPTPTNTTTPAPSATITNTPTPTTTGAPTATPTTVVLAQSNPTNTPAATTVPTIPSAGSSSGVYFMVVAGVVLASLLLVF